MLGQIRLPDDAPLFSYAPDAGRGQTRHHPVTRTQFEKVLHKYLIHARAHGPGDGGRARLLRPLLQEGGGAHFAFNNGISADLIQVRGADRKSDACKLYVEASDKNKLSSARAITAALAKAGQRGAASAR